MSVIFLFCAFLYFLSFLQIAHNTFVIRKTTAIKRKQQCLLFKAPNQGLPALIEIAQPHASSPLSENSWEVGESIKGSTPVSKRWWRSFKANAPLWQKHTFLYSCSRWAWRIPQRQLPTMSTCLGVWLSVTNRLSGNLFFSHWHIWREINSCEKGVETAENAIRFWKIRGLETDILLT